MSFVPTDIFNFVEGLFWVILGSFALVAYRGVPKGYKHLALFSGFVLLAFGISDWLQVYFGSFLTPGMEWLLVWKIVNVLGLCLAAVWYVWLRLRS